MKKALIVSIVVSVALLIALIVLVVNKSSPINPKLLAGEWKETRESQYLTLKLDHSFSLSIAGSGQNFQGTWQITDVKFDSTAASFLILKNADKKKYELEDYFSYYTFQIDSVKNDRLYLTDLSGTLRKNKRNVYERISK